MKRPQTDDLLRELIAEVRGLRADLRRQWPVPADDSDSWLAAVLPELARMPTFTAAMAVKRVPLLAEYARPHGAMALGHRLAVSVDVVVDGRSLVRRGDYRGRAAYCVRTVWSSSVQAVIADVRTSPIPQSARHLQRVSSIAKSRHGD